MDQSFVIGYLEVTFLGGIVALFSGVVVWAVNGRLNRVDQSMTEIKDQMVRDKAEQAERTDRAVADLKDEMVRDKAEVMEWIKQIDERVRQIDERVRQSDERSEERVKQSDERSDEHWRAAGAQSEKQDALHEGRHREIQGALREVNYRVGRLEGAGGVSDGPAPRSGRHSPQQADEPPAASGSEPDPALVAERDDAPIALVAGVRTEPALAAGRAHQAVPGPEQAGQQTDETEREPPSEDPPDTAR